MLILKASLHLKIILEKRGKNSTFCSDDKKIASKERWAKERKQSCTLRRRHGEIHNCTNFRKLPEGRKEKNLWKMAYPKGSVEITNLPFLPTLGLPIEDGSFMVGNKFNRKYQTSFVSFLLGVVVCTKIISVAIFIYTHRTGILSVQFTAALNTAWKVPLKKRRSHVWVQCTGRSPEGA